MNQPREQILAHVHRQLGELRASTAHSQKLIDDIQATLNHLSQVNPASAVGMAAPAPPPVGAPLPPQQPQPQFGPPPQFSAPPQPGQAPPPREPLLTPHPPKPKLTTEQQVMRWAAVVGSIITFVGVSFGIGLAIQTGLLGPVGRMVGAALLALILLAVGIRVDLRKGKNAGVMALYITSFLIFILNLLDAAEARGWLTSLGLVSSFLVLWLVYLALAHWRKSPQLVLAMCIILVFYTLGMTSWDGLANALLMVAPVAVILVSWLMPMYVTPRLLAIVRGVAGLLLAWQIYAATWATGSRLFREDTGTPIDFAVTMPLIGLVLLVLGEIFFGAPGAKRAYRIVPAVVAPAVILMASNTMVKDAGVWLPFITAIGVTLLVLVLQAKNNPQFVYDLITGWFIVLPFTLNRPLAASRDFTRENLHAEAIPIFIFLALAITLLLFIHRLPVNTLAVLASWTIMLFNAILPLLVGALIPFARTGWSWFVLFEGLMLVALIVVAATRKAVWSGMTIGARGVFAAVGLLLEMVAVVTLADVTKNAALFLSGAPTTPTLEASEGGFYTGHMIVSISWMAVASWLLLKRPSAMDTKNLRKAGLLMAIVATLKLVFFDMAAIGGIMRVITFIVCGLILIAVAVRGAQQVGAGASNRAGNNPYANSPGPNIPTASPSQVTNAPSGAQPPAN